MQALAEFIFSNPKSVFGKRVIDVGCGLGVAGIAAALAGARATAGMERRLGLWRHLCRCRQPCGAAPVAQCLSPSLAGGAETSPCCMPALNERRHATPLLQHTATLNVTVNRFLFNVCLTLHLRWPRRVPPLRRARGRPLGPRAPRALLCARLRRRQRPALRAAAGGHPPAGRGGVRPLPRIRRGGGRGHGAADGGGAGGGLAQPA